MGLGKFLRCWLSDANEARDVLLDEPFNPEEKSNQINALAKTANSRRPLAWMLIMFLLSTSSIETAT
jgi:hypothetical protein